MQKQLFKNATVLPSHLKSFDLKTKCPGAPSPRFHSPQNNLTSFNSLSHPRRGRKFNTKENPPQLSQAAVAWESRAGVHFCFFPHNCAIPCQPRGGGGAMPLCVKRCQMIQFNGKGRRAQDLQPHLVYSSLRRSLPAEHSTVSNRVLWQGRLEGEKWCLVCNATNPLPSPGAHAWQEAPGPRHVRGFYLTMETRAGRMFAPLG